MSQPLQSSGFAKCGRVIALRVVALVELERAERTELDAEAAALALFVLDHHDAAEVLLLRGGLGGSRHRIAPRGASAGIDRARERRVDYYAPRRRNMDRDQSAHIFAAIYFTILSTRHIDHSTTGPLHDRANPPGNGPFERAGMIRHARSERGHARRLWHRPAVRFGPHDGARWPAGTPLRRRRVGARSNRSARGCREPVLARLRGSRPQWRCAPAVARTILAAHGRSVTRAVACSRADAAAKRLRGVFGRLALTDRSRRGP